MKKLIFLFGIALMVSMVSCGRENTKDPLIYNPKSLKESVWTVADSVATPEQLAMKKKLNEMIWNCVQVKDNRLTLTGGKEYFKKNGIPEIYYDFALESLKETNDGLDKWEKEGQKVDVNKLFEDAKKEYLTTKQK